MRSSADGFFNKKKDLRMRKERFCSSGLSMVQIHFIESSDSVGHTSSSLMVNCNCGCGLTSKNHYPYGRPLRLVSLETGESNLQFSRLFMGLFVVPITNSFIS